jgi:hypothetical protein
MIFIKKIIKAITSFFSADIYERVLAYSILSKIFSSIKTVPIYKVKEDLWTKLSQIISDKGKDLLFIEYGVWRGYSIKWFSNKFKSKGSRFIGLDSFEGLPENWGSMKSSTFTTGGETPDTSDARVSFIKGWFQDTPGELDKCTSSAHMGPLALNSKRHFSAHCCTSLSC